jgi:predicted P-loop ATPase
VIEAFRGVVDQLWAEAVAELDRGAEWHLTGDLVAAAALEAEERREDSPWEDAIVKWAPTAPFTTHEVYAALGAAKSDHRAGYQIRDALTVLGYRQVRPRVEASRALGARVWVRTVPD